MLAPPFSSNWRLFFARIDGARLAGSNVFVFIPAPKPFSPFIPKRGHDPVSSTIRFSNVHYNAGRLSTSCRTRMPRRQTGKRPKFNKAEIIDTDSAARTLSACVSGRV